MGRVEEVSIRAAEIRAKPSYAQLDAFELAIPMILHGSEFTVTVAVTREQTSLLAPRARAAFERALHATTCSNEEELLRDAKELLDAVGEDVELQIFAHVGQRERESDSAAFSDETIAARRAVALPSGLSELHPLNDFPALRAGRDSSGSRGAPRYAVSLPLCDSMEVAIFYELAVTIRDCLEELGYDAIVCGYGDAPERRHIALNTNYAVDRGLPLPPPSAILYNADQAGCLTSAARALYRKHIVWDYTPASTNDLRALNIPRVRCVPPGSTARLAYLEQPQGPSQFRVIGARSGAEKPADVLIVGADTRRRATLVNELARHGIDARIYLGVWGKAREDAVRAAKINLNVANSPRNAFEPLRVGWLLSRGCFVVSEARRHAQWEGGYVSAPYEEIVATCIRYLERPEERAAIAARGHELFMADTMTERLREALTDFDAIEVGSPPPGSTRSVAQRGRRSQATTPVIINNFNYGRFVGEAIKSALTQTYGQTEVVVVDDGSTDSSK